MIPQRYITQWRSSAPWANDALVEQDLVISLCLVKLFSNSLLRDLLAFRGGTALQKLYLNSALRFSEDIDLVRKSTGPARELISEVRDTLDDLLGKPSTKQTAATIKLLYRFETEAMPRENKRLKIEINVRETFSVFGFRELNYMVENDSEHAGAVAIPCFCLEELLGTKMRALYQRKKGRDLFDLLTMLDEHRDMDPQKIVHCFEQYCQFQGISVSRAQFEQNLGEKMQDAEFMADITTVVKPGLTYDHAAAVEVVQDRLVSLLRGKPFKKA